MPGPVSGRGCAVPPLLRRHSTNATARLSAQGTVERRPPTTEGMPGYARHSLGSLPLVTFTPPPGAGQGPARPRWGGPGHFSLDGRQGGGVPSYRGKRPHRWSGLVWRRVGGFFFFSDVGVNARIFGWMSGASTSIRAHIRNSRLYVWMD